MDMAKKAQQKRFRKLKKQNQKHGWLILDNDYTSNKIYTCYENNSYVEVSFVTEEKINPLHKGIKVEYKGLVNECLGNMPKKPNIIKSLLNKIYEESCPNVKY